MKTLLILRHGKSSWKYENLADHDRPLKKRGKRDATNIGTLTQDLDLVPDLILSSTAKRAVDTAKLFSESADFDGEILYTRSLYHGDPQDYISQLCILKNNINCAMVVGHNPGLEELLFHFTEVDEWIPTAALAQIRLDIHDWSEIANAEGELINYWRPRDLI